MRAACFISLIAAVILPAMSSAQGENDTLQNHVFVTGLTYDDGFGVALADPAGIWYQKETGEVYVADAGNGRVVIYDSLLTPLYSFKHYIVDRTTGKRELGQPRSMVVTDEGEILLLDGRSDRLDLLDFRGAVLESVAPNKLLGDTTLRLAFTAVTMDTANQFYVLVIGDVSRVMILDRDLNLIRAFGERGNLREQFTSPEAIGYSDGKIYVADSRGVPVVKIFDTTGQFLSGFGGHDIKAEDISLPSGIAFLDNPFSGRVILVVDGLRQVTKLYNTEGSCISMIGGFGYALGLLQYPSGIASDGLTTYYVVEKVGERVQRYSLK